MVVTEGVRGSTDGASLRTRRLCTLLVHATPFNELFLATVGLLGFSLWSLVSARGGSPHRRRSSRRDAARGLLPSQP